jgi:dienelactone hydrolase
MSQERIGTERHVEVPIGGLRFPGTLDAPPEVRGLVLFAHGSGSSRLLTGPVIAEVRAPTLLIVGERDPAVLELNRQAYAQLRTEKELAVVSGATHLFEEPGALEEVSLLAADWFVRHLS